MVFVVFQSPVRITTERRTAMILPAKFGLQITRLGNDRLRDAGHPLATAPRCVLLWDASTQTVGLVADDGPNSVAIHRNAKNGVARVISSAFLSFASLKPGSFLVVGNNFAEVADDPRMITIKLFTDPDRDEREWFGRPEIRLALKTGVETANNRAVGAFVLIKHGTGYPARFSDAISPADVVCEVSSAGRGVWTACRRGKSYRQKLDAGYFAPLAPKAKGPRPKGVNETIHADDDDE